VGVGVGEEWCFFGLMTWILSVAVAELPACFEVAVTVSVILRPARSLNALSLACVSWWSPALRPDTVHRDPPVWSQTVKEGLTLFGVASTSILTEPLLPLVSQTQIAKCTVVPGSTVLLLPRVRTVMQSVALGGGVVVELLGVGVALLVGVGVVEGVGVLFVPPGATVGLWLPLPATFPLEPGFGVLLGPELGVTLPPPGEGFGVGGAGVDGCGLELGSGGDVVEAAFFEAEWCAGPEEAVRAAASRSIGRRAA